MLHCNQAILYHISSKKLSTYFKILTIFVEFLLIEGATYSKGALIYGQEGGRLDWIFFNPFIIGEWVEPRSHFIRPSHFFFV